MNHSQRARKPRIPLNAASLQELALAYVARFATSRGKLLRYLDRKVRERGWDGEGEARDAAERTGARLAELGYVDDAAYATSRARSFTSRGLGARRLSADLSAAGIAPEDRESATSVHDAPAAAMRFAEKRRLGPFAVNEADPALREKQLSAMLRAGHSLGLAKRILACKPGDEPDFS